MELPTLKFVVALGLVAALGCEPSQDLAPSTPSTAKSTPVPEEKSDDRPQRVDASKPVRQRQTTMGRLRYETPAELDYYGRFQQPLDHYYASNGEYPKSHEEFMRKVWEPLKTPMPDIEDGYRYEYDPSDHRVYKVLIEQGEPDSAEE